MYLDVQKFFHCMPEREKRKKNRQQEKRENTVNLYELLFNYKLQIIEHYSEYVYLKKQNNQLKAEV